MNLRKKNLKKNHYLIKEFVKKGEKKNFEKLQKNKNLPKKNIRGLLKIKILYPLLKKKI